jgi:hypothetical protein
MADTLTHSCDPYARALRSKRSQLFGRDSFATILNLQQYAVGAARKVYGRSFASGMAMNVSQALLYDTKNRQFKVGGEPAEVLRNAKLDFQIRTLLQTLHVPMNRLRQAVFIQQGRMQ